MEGNTSDHVTGCLPGYQPMVLVFCALAAGILIDRALDLSAGIYVCVAVVCGLAWFSIFFTRAAEERPRRGYFRVAWMSCILLLAIAAVGAIWHHADWNWVGHNNIALYASEVAQPVCVEGRVISEPRWQAVEEDGDPMQAIPAVDRTRVVIKPIRIRNALDWETVSGKVDLVIHQKCDHVRSGDRVWIFGTLVAISGPSNPGQFDFRSFYRSVGKSAVLHAFYPDAVEVIQPAGNWTGSQLLPFLRRKMNEIAWRYVPPEQAGLASAVLLGNREQLTSSRRELFLLTGTVHLLAISGLHVGILAGVFFFFFRVGLIRRETFLWATILFVCFYAWLVEFRAPVSRATILIVLMCVGRMKGQSILSFNWLAAAGCVVLLINPSDLFQIGPQLSFLAVATISFGREWLFWPPSSDPIKRLIANTRPFHVRLVNWLGRQTRAAFLVSGLIWLVAMPLVAIRFNLIAPVALLINPILLLPIAIALYGGLGVLVFGWFSPPLAGLCGTICGWGLGTIEQLIALASGVPAGHSWTAGPTVTAVVCYYVGVFFLAVFPRTRVSAKWFLLATFLWLVFAWWVPDAIHAVRQRQSERNLAVTFVDVGHGTSILLELPDGRCMLYDAGSLGSSSFAARNISSVLWHRRIEHLDAIVLSHADVDHFNAVPELCEKFSVGVVYMSAPMREHAFTTTKRLVDVLQSHGVRIETLAKGDHLLSRPCNIEVLSPPVFGTDDSDNSNSVVALVSYENRRVLLTGDLESNGLDLLLSAPPIDVDVLLVPHHGSMDSAPRELTRWCEPEAVVISGSSKRIDPEVEAIFEDSGARVFRTDRDGAIRFEMPATGLQVAPFVRSRQK
jgi:competence protein ComEC